MANDFDYYICFPKLTDNIPLLKNDDEHDIEGSSFLYKREVPENNKLPVHLTFNSPFPLKPKMVDFHAFDFPVFSNRIYDVLEPLNIKYLQLFSVIIRGNKGEKYDNYWIANMYNRLECFDKEKSVFKLCPLTKRWNNIEKIVLSKDGLSKIPLDERLVFVAKESVRFKLFHKSIVEKIMSVNPEGIAFIPLEEYHE